MKYKNDVHADVILDALDLKFSKDMKLNQKIARLFKKINKNKKDVVNPVEVFAFSTEDTLFLIKQKHPRKVKHLLFLDSHTQEPFHVQNIRNYKIK